jgi:hypothetical protein
MKKLQLFVGLQLPLILAMEAMLKTIKAEIIAQSMAAETFSFNPESKSELESILKDSTDLAHTRIEMLTLLFIECNKIVNHYTLHSNELNETVVKEFVKKMEGEIKLLDDLASVKVPDEILNGSSTNE